MLYVLNANKRPLQRKRSQKEIENELAIAPETEGRLSMFLRLYYITLVEVASTSGE